MELYPDSPVQNLRKWYKYCKIFARLKVGTKLKQDPRLRTDQLLLGRIVERDRSAFHILFEERGPAILGVLCLLLDKAEAEEVLVDVFGSVWEEAPSFQANGASPFAWMLGLARTKAAERLHVLRASRVAVADQPQQQSVEHPDGERRRPTEAGRTLAR